MGHRYTPDEIEAIREAFERIGTVAGAARSLKVPRQTVDYLLRREGYLSKKLQIGCPLGLRRRQPTSPTAEEMLAAHGTQVQAAKALGISPQAFSQRLQRERTGEWYGTRRRRQTTTLTQ